MKEHIDYIVSSIIDYNNQEHHFVIAAVSQELPTYTCQLEDCPIDENVEVNYHVGEIIENYGQDRSLGTVCKILRLGVAVCHPNDLFDEEVGIRKAVARAKHSIPALYSTKLGTINTRMVRALLEQEAVYLVNNPENLIKGYNTMRKNHFKREKMELLKSNFSDLENQILEKLQENPEFLNNVLKYTVWTEKSK